MSLSDRIRHFFHVISTVRPIVWICLYIGLTPVFALIYWALPDSQFRIPAGAGTDFGSWLYYSIVTITTLGFGDYTPAHGWAQAVTAVEVMCGLTTLGFFLNAVGSLKSEIDVTSEIEKQKALHEAAEKHKLIKSIPSVLHNLNLFLSYCYAATTPLSRRNDSEPKYNPEFSLEDLKDIYRPTGLPTDHSNRPAIDALLRTADRTSLCLDSLQTRIDLTQWPDLLEDCFAFVANCQMFSSADVPTEKETAAAPAKIASADTNPAFTPGTHPLLPVVEFIRENAGLARKIEIALTKIDAAEQA